MSYNPDHDFIDCYFIILEDSKKGLNEIVAWSTNKRLIKFYLEFHGTKKLKVKKLSDYKKNLNEICNAHINEEIQIGHMTTVIKGKPTIVMAPLTELDLTQINDFSGCFNEIEINYAMLHQLVPCLKSKYREALKTILLNEVIEAVIFPKQGLRVTNIHLDEVVLLHRLTMDLF